MQRWAEKGRPPLNLSQRVLICGYSSFSQNHPRAAVPNTVKMRPQGAEVNNIFHMHEASSSDTSDSSGFHHGDNGATVEVNQPNPIPVQAFSRSQQFVVPSFDVQNPNQMNRVNRLPLTYPYSCNYIYPKSHYQSVPSQNYPYNQRHQLTPSDTSLIVPIDHSFAREGHNHSSVVMLNADSFSAQNPEFPNIQNYNSFSGQITQDHFLSKKTAPQFVPKRHFRTPEPMILETVPRNHVPAVEVTSAQLDFPESLLQVAHQKAAVSHDHSNPKTLKRRPHLATQYAPSTLLQASSRSNLARPSISGTSAYSKGISKKQRPVVPAHRVTSSLLSSFTESHFETLSENEPESNFKQNLLGTVTKCTEGKGQQNSVGTSNVLEDDAADCLLNRETAGKLAFSHHSRQRYVKMLPILLHKCLAN